MLVDICAHILQPKDEGDYIVLVSAFSCEQAFSTDRRLQKIAAAESMEQAATVRQRLMPSCATRSSATATWSAR